jgi:predicted acylesterase/phospholipase RssA
MLQNLVICGGGINIVSYVGVLQYLSEKDLLKHVNNYYGTSAGGIISVMLALEYSIDEIKRFLFTFDFQRVIDELDPTLLFDNMGLSTGKNMEIITKSVISFKLGEDKIDYSLKELYQDKKIKLTLTTYNLTNKCNVYWNHESDVPIWKALVSSCRIPFIFTPFEINENKFVDGGICDNFPIHFISRDQLKHTLAIYCYGSVNQTSIGYPLIDYIYDLMTIYMESTTNNFLTMYRPIIVYLKTVSVFVNFELTNDQKQQMFDLGYQTMHERLPDIQQFWESSNTYTDNSTQTD